MKDTIAALATPPGEGGLAVIRISGDEAFAAAAKLFQPLKKASVSEYASHTVHLGWVSDSEGRKLDQVLLTIFRAPNSYTGEDVVEISGHGGRRVSQQILEAVLSAGARMAEPGEFTKRAFLNGKLDLTQAEAVLDLIRAKSDLAARTALRQLEGALSGRLRELKDLLMQVYAHMEAFLDFPEEDLEIYSNETFMILFQKIETEMAKLIASFERSVLLKEGITCVFAGKPNVGKSSLFNALLARDRALVSEHAGTTRDALEESVEIGGITIRLVDTAGLGHRSENPLDKMGMERTRHVLESAQLVFFVVDGSAPLEEADETLFREAVKERPFLILINKSDRPEKIDLDKLQKLCGVREFIRVSAQKQDGLETLQARIEKIIADAGIHQESEQITRLRHKKALESALESLRRAQDSFQKKESLDLVSLDLKVALDQLSELLGEIYSEDLLDVIFSEFCIGK